jgi:hypothetical protein
MHAVVEKIIVLSYLKLLKDSYFPSVSMVLERCKDTIEREALDTMYLGEVNLDITESQVSEVLVRFKHAHTYFGEPMFDAQNVLFLGWLEHLKLLKGG